MLDQKELDEFAAMLEVPEHRELFAYWRSKARPGRLPARKDIDPIDIPKLLPWLSLVEVDWSGEAPRFRFRVVGTSVAERFGRDATGLWFEDAYDDPKIYEAQMAIFTQVATTRQPSLTRPVPPIPDREFITCRRLIVPMTGDDDRVSQMISLLNFDDERLRK